MIAVIVVIVLLLFVVALQIVRISAETDFDEAVEKCRDCKHFTGRDDEHRFIYCNNYQITPEEALDCSHFEKKKEKE